MLTTLLKLASIVLNMSDIAEHALHWLGATCGNFIIKFVYGLEAGWERPETW